MGGCGWVCVCACKRVCERERERVCGGGWVAGWVWVGVVGAFSVWLSCNTLHSTILLLVLRLGESISGGRFRERERASARAHFQPGAVRSLLHCILRFYEPTGGEGKRGRRNLEPGWGARVRSRIVTTSPCLMIEGQQFRVWGLGFGVSGFGFGVWGLGFGV